MAKAIFGILHSFVEDQPCLKGVEQTSLANVLHKWQADESYAAFLEASWVQMPVTANMPRANRCLPLPLER